VPRGIGILEGIAPCVLIMRQHRRRQPKVVAAGWVWEYALG
jgi:hypothetical protein